MQHFDRDYAEKLRQRLKAIQSDQRPQWGDLQPAALIGHLTWMLKHAMGKSTKVPDYSTWFTRSLMKPLLLKGIIPIPKNQALPASLEQQGIRTIEPGDLESFQALMEEYLRRIQDDELTPAPHPYLGEMTIDEWDRFHILHFEHHLRQFKV